MIRILHIVTTMNRGGLETMLMNYYRHIDREKVQFDFLVHREAESAYDKEILTLGGRIYHISKLIPWSKKYQNELRSFFGGHPEYRIVHVHQDCLSSIALKCAYEEGIPVRIAHSHNSSADKNIKYAIKRYYMKKIPKYATALFACGKAAGNWMFGGREYHVLQNAIEAEKYQYSEMVAKSIKKSLGMKDELLIGHVGRFNPQKNHDFLIDVFYEVTKKCPAVKLLLVGDGDLKKEIQEKVSSLGISDNVIFTGIRSDVNELLQAIDVFLFPSLYEGLPVTMIEAQAAGLPCLISDQISSECIITKGLVTYKHLKDSPAVWANQILLLSENKKRNAARTSYYDEIKKSGYDVTEAASWLQEYYMAYNGE